MTRLTLVATIMLASMVGPALATPSATELENARVACRDSFLSRDLDAYLDAAATMLGWEDIEDPDVAREVELCLALSSALDGADIEEIRTRIAANTDTVALDNPAQAEDDARLAEYLARAQSSDTDLADLAMEIAADEDFSPSASNDRDALEAALNAYVLPIPASRAQLNLIAYRALARINPDTPRYQERAQRYEEAIEAEHERSQRSARQLEGRLIRTVAEFDGSSWARHPSSPRFQDIRNYITLYLIETSSGHQSLELFINYTSRDGWLFVENASVNIDGETTRLPIPRWFRDNNTRIWEFGSIRGPAALTIGRQIADADRVVIRFNGQQFYYDYVVSEGDKRIIHEMLEMWDIISSN